MSAPVSAYLVCGGKYHDIDFARVELLKLLALFETRFSGEAPGFAEHSWSGDEPRIVMYLHRHGEGEVLYNTLGHCRGKYDMRPIMDEYPVVERCSWELPVFYELLRRGLRWALGGLEAV